MKENVSGYSRNPCSLNRERDTAFAAKLLTLPTGFFSAEKPEEWMARSRHSNHGFILSLAVFSCHINDLVCKIQLFTQNEMITFCFVV